MIFRRSLASSLGGEPKKDGSRRDGKAEEKSGGVTSETNHGISLGLVGVDDQQGIPGRRFLNLDSLEDHL